MVSTSLGLGRRLVLGLVCFVLGACNGTDGSLSGTGGTGPGQAGASGTAGSTGASGSGVAGTTGTGGATGAKTGSGGTSTGGTGLGVAGDGSGTGGTSMGGSVGTGGAPTGVGGSSGTGGSLGGGGDAGAGTAGAGGTSACPAGAGFCDSFERAGLGPDWTIDNTVAANVVEVVTDQGHTGSNSVHMKFGSGATATFIDETKGFPATDYWGRVWLLVKTGLESGHHVYIEGSTGVNMGNTGIRALNTQGAGKIATNNAPPDTGGTSNVNMPQGMWTCFEWHIAATGGKENVTLYMTGIEVPGTAASTTPAVTNLIKQRIGYERYSGTMTGELWIDDYATGPMRIPCGL